MKKHLSRLQDVPRTELAMFTDFFSEESSKSSGESLDNEQTHQITGFAAGCCFIAKKMGLNNEKQMLIAKAAKVIVYSKNHLLLLYTIRVDRKITRLKSPDKGQLFTELPGCYIWFE